VVVRNVENIVVLRLVASAARSVNVRHKHPSEQFAVSQPTGGAFDGLLCKLAAASQARISPENHRSTQAAYISGPIVR
jgi:hypothetical protein